MFNKRLKNLMALMAALALVLVVTGCDNNGEENGNGGEEYPYDNGGETGPVERERLVIGHNANPISLDLHRTNDNASAVVMREIFQTLVHQDEDMVIHPGLATEWEQIDLYTWHFTIRDDVHFHNGDLMTVEDVVFSLRRGADSPSVDAILGMLDSDRIEVIDENTVQIATEMPFAPLLSHLAHIAAGVMNESVVTGMADDEIARNPVGTGPFEFVEWETDVSVLVRRFEDFHGDLPAFREMLFRIITDPESRFIELETRGIDIMLGVGAAHYARAQSEGFNLLKVQGLQTSYLGMNVRHPQLSDNRVRRAINYAIDVEIISEALTYGYATPAASPISPNVFGANPNLDPFPFDPDRARELLAEAGVEGLTLDLYTTNVAANLEMSQIIQQNLADVGITVEIHAYEWGTFIEEVDREGGVDVFFMAWGTITGDADYGLFPLFHTSSIGPAGNRTHFSHPDVDALLDRGREVIDPDERLEIYHEVLDILRYESPWVPMLQGLAAVATQPEVRGFRTNPTNSHFFSGVYFVE